MALHIVFGNKLTVAVSPLTWNMIPYNEQISPYRKHVGWLCFSAIIESASKEKQKEWSDEQVIREIKALEKEVESQKLSLIHI